ncbi:hypothetical protein BJ684DRAFT_9724 [Piptocephalis cylindrospora]|uniref:NAD-dependent epimerase/dehydratase domain-containing protein n=1 Tax=Piptocephalis cylindrospora TaxID=1907219 RepID=A0A4P9Y423_9FUNG|nr:hypothetical protein BJ684DRAFT_9724 [Piptocephalis cylindrospora]|eukprot:RKP13677.1 hypothetical protein BJ684DRAFT_9724 [Piptocephalis cylindrospora]
MIKKILVVGGLTSVGRHVVALLVPTYGVQSGSLVRVVDEKMPRTSHLSRQHVRAFDAAEYCQVNMSNPSAVEEAFSLPNGGTFDWVINCSSVASNWEVEEVHRQRFLIRPVMWARQARASGVKAYVHMSTAIFYKERWDAEGNPVRCTEECPMEAITLKGRYTLRMEKELQAIQGLPLILVRPAVLWGPDEMGLFGTMLIGSDIFSRIKKTWELTATKDVRYSLAHVVDVARAMIHLAEWYVQEKVQGTMIYNISDTSPGRAEETLEAYEQVFPGFQYRAVSSSNEKIPSLDEIQRIMNEMNDLIQEHWLFLLKDHHIVDSPLIPHVDLEYGMFHNTYIDGTAIIRDTDFNYLHDKGMNKEEIIEIIHGYMDRNLWPRRVLGDETETSYEATDVLYPSAHR